VKQTVFSDCLTSSKAGPDSKTRRKCGEWKFDYSQSHLDKTCKRNLHETAVEWNCSNNFSTAEDSEMRVRYTEHKRTSATTATVMIVVALE
jgi:hypothetical protein